VSGITQATALWYASRATGIVLFVLLTLVVLLGLLVSRRGRLPGLPRFAVTGLHRAIALIAVVFLLVHVLTAVADGYVTIQLIAAVVPFTSSYLPLPMALGAVALDLMLAVVVTSLLRTRLGARTWRAVHWLAYAAYPVAVLHSVTSAADLRSGVLLALTVLLLAAVAAAVAWRVVTAARDRQAASPAILASSPLYPPPATLWSGAPASPPHAGSVR